MDIEKLITHLSNVKSGSSFLTIHNYRNAKGEVSDYQIVFNSTYENAVRNSLAQLKAMKPKSKEERKIVKELIVQLSSQEAGNSYLKQVETSSGKPVKNLKVHKDNGGLYLCGTVVNKRTHKSFGVSDKEPTLKDQVLAKTSVGRYRQFILDAGNFEKIVVDKVEIKAPKA